MNINIIENNNAVKAWVRVIYDGGWQRLRGETSYETVGWGDEGESPRDHV